MTDLGRKRRAAGLTQQQLAQRLGVTVYAVSAWEQRKRSPCCHYMEQAIERALEERPVSRRRKPAPTTPQEG